VPQNAGYGMFEILIPTQTRQVEPQTATGRSGSELPASNIRHTEIARTVQAYRSQQPRNLETITVDLVPSWKRSS
jgi:hypothetical protein